jgi:hypothetical protein
MLEQTTREDVPVPFAGLPAETGPLTWGQQGTWRDMLECGLSFGQSAVHALPEGTTVEDRAAHLASLVSRHPALRMRFGTDADGKPCQVVPSSGDAALDIVRIPGDADDDLALRYALEVMRVRRDAPVDPYRDRLLRLSLVIRGGALLYQACTVSHLVADGVAFSRLYKALAPASWPGPGEGTRPASMGILDLAWRERTDPLRRLSRRAMRYWEKQLRSAPPLTFGEPAHPEGRQGRRYWHGRFSSPAAHLAVLAIADRTRADTSSVMHAVIATSIARATGVNPLTTKINVSNRFRPGYSDVLAPISQKSVITIDTADASLDEVIAQTRKALLAAGMFGYYDPQQLGELTARIAAERGQPARITCLINDARVAKFGPAQEAVAGAPVTIGRIRDKLAESFLVWDGTLDNFHEQAWISVLDYPETVWLQVIFDMACFTETQAEAVMRGVEEVAVEAAFDPGAPTRVNRAGDRRLPPG